MAPKKSARTATVDPVLDRRLVSTAEGALPVHSRISVKLGKTWENGLVTQTWNTLGPTGRPLIMYKIAYDNGKEQECDLSVQDARLITSHAADTPRLQRKASYIDPRDLAQGPVVGVTNIPSPSKLGSLKVPELRRMCSDLGLENKGAKKELMEQLTRAHSATQAMLSGQVAAGAILGEDASASEEEMNGLKEEMRGLNETVASLRAELASERTALATVRAEEFQSAAKTLSLEAKLASNCDALVRSEAWVTQLRGTVESRDAELASLRAQLESSEQRELGLQAELLELKGNVRVLCRLRPAKVPTKDGPVAEASGMMSSGITRSLTMRGVPSTGPSTSNLLSPKAQNVGGPTRSFQFDRVFGSTASNSEVYGELRPLARSVADGSRATVLAYGQTGSGKTFTMLGMQKLAVQQVLDSLGCAAGRTGGSVLQLRLSIVEVHNEKLQDLLDDDADKKIELRQGHQGQPFVEGASWHGVGSAEVAGALVDAAARRRVTADNGLNERSSRSHLVMIYQVVSQLSDSHHFGQLTLVDLAGSERLSRTEATGALQIETAAINKSLSALGDVMTAIAAKDAHVPFRNSKLTYLLQPALAKGSRVMFIVTASPDAVDAPETLVSLGFGTRARNAQLGRERAVTAATPSAGGGLLSPQAARGGATPGRAGMPTTPGRAGMPTTPGRVNASPRPVGSACGKRPATPGGAGVHSAKRQLAEVN